ncbi:conserved hypothetical protein [Ricinus communis]|uniref:Uncharacterized protein n=1 Tax=Ricinus communis TaxID=3988 RepID=B9SEB9_RICCO|nr:conserved hypothetical protein [Ricinus communis]
MDKKEDKGKDNLEDPEPKSPASDENISQDNDTLQKQQKSKTDALPLNDASSEALLKTTHEDQKENIKNPEEALNNCNDWDCDCKWNIKQLHDKINRFNSEESMAIQGLESKIQALLHEGDQDYKDFKNADQGCKSLMKLMMLAMRL